MTMTADSIQLSFVNTDFRPVRHGASHYVAAVQNKKGELSALGQATRDTWDRMTPLVAVVGWKRRPATYQIETVARWVKHVADAVGRQPIFLDVLRLRPGHPTVTPRGNQQVLAVIHEQARKRGMAFVPVVRIGDPYAAEYSAIVRDTAARDGRGAALRYPIRTLLPPPGTTHTAMLSGALIDIAVDVEHADILIDLSFISR